MKIRLRSGGQIKTTIERVELSELHRELQQSQFVRVGDDTVVRSEDVEAICCGAVTTTATS